MPKKRTKVPVRSHFWVLQKRVGQQTIEWLRSRFLHQLSSPANIHLLASELVRELALSALTTIHLICYNNKTGYDAQRPLPASSSQDKSKNRRYIE